MKRPYTDAHLHLTSLSPDMAEYLVSGPECMLSSSVFTLNEWEHLCKIEADVKARINGSFYSSRDKHNRDSEDEIRNRDIVTGNEEIRIIKTFGIHPQNPDVEMLEVLEKLLSVKQNSTGILNDGSSAAPDAIGEAGYDFFTKVFEAQEQQQDEVWYGQLELAEKYGKPLVVHLRHAVDRMFRDAEMLKRLPAVIFHSFPGSPLEAEALRKRGVNAYFSFGKPVLNHRRNSIECVRKLPEEWLLFETDAPYQTLKGEESTKPSDIVRVFKAAAWLRGMDETGSATVETTAETSAYESGCERLAETVRTNFRKAFLLD